MTNWLAYAGAILTGLIPPLIMYLIGSQKKSPRLCHHQKRADD